VALGFGAPQALGALVLVASGIGWAILRYLDRLVDPVDLDTVSTTKLDGYVRQLVEWRLFPLVRELHTEDEIPPKRSVDRIIAVYNVRLEKIARAEFASEDFGRARVTMERGLFWAGVSILPAASVVGLGSLDFTAAAIAVPFMVAYLVFMTVAVNSLTRLRRARADYRVAVDGLQLAASDDQAVSLRSGGNGP
jgi:hypothetical protein